MNRIRKALEEDKESLCDEALIHAHEQREKTLRDRESEIIVARDKGRAEAKIEMARKMLAMNMPLEKIQLLTGLSQGEIESL